MDIIYRNIFIYMLHVFKMMDEFTDLCKKKNIMSISKSNTVSQTTMVAS